MAVADLIESPVRNTEHAEALLELAFAVSAVDGHLADEELGTFREVVARVRGKTATDEEIGQLLERFVVASHAEGTTERARRVAPRIPPELREVAFEIAFGLSLVDRQEEHEEGELLAELARDLGLSEARAGELRAQVRTKLSIG